jgi:hypothetical protein
MRSGSTLRHTALKLAALALAVLVISGGVTASGRDEPRRRAEKRTFTDAEILDGFFKLAFGAEFRFGRRTERIRKYDGPVRVFVENRGQPDRHAQLIGIIADIRTRMKDLDIALTSERGEANAIVTLVRDRDLMQTIRDVYGPDRARRIQRAHDPQCLAGYSKDDSSRILRAEVILVVDAGDFVFRDCAYEEILQALGPINDDESVPWSMFNDAVSLGYFGVYDQLLLNLLYDPRVKPGMTREEAQAVLPTVLPDVRAFVARTNNLPHP